MSTVEKQKAGSMYGLDPYVATKGEEYMGEPMKKHFIKLLGAWKQDLMTSVDRTVDHMKDEAANFPDPADRASQEEEFALELRNRDRERKLIKKIDKTLQKIQDDEYGWCDSCGVEIGLRRLEARPTADLCFDCKEIAEKKEKTVGKG
ncbi:RNA polymerase-binding protein DksA [Pseudomonas huaxiensis]|uniref:RNA polymerase-binding protein DksA n=1 Tax=Pseudomonas huaxiensis TaxID=2213017 RepID=UPI000DA6D4FA|nr:RNA polymerase-binding protein DksA [Pseudomonas huaxiensis]